MDTLIKTLEDGRTAHVTPLVTLFGEVSYQAVDDEGRRITDGWLYEADRRGVQPDQRPAGCTHMIPGYPSPVWFTAEEAARLEEIGAAAKAAFDASEEGRGLRAWRERQEEERREAANRTAVLRSPEGVALVEERARLVAAAAAVLEVDAVQRERAHADEGGDQGAYYRDQAPGNEAAHARAVAALEEFDAAHPEIVTALREEEAAEVRRRMESD
jgi:hypothetical protein